ncbi:hypothetical protein H5972_04565 [Ligilactobacillus salivarius]|uniref:hypothetical protein n=1 Tax=Ligilactobacillus salivarius TaxID=1624 RepID=UPI00195D5D07|nr:hypothetical protein [Ligilactobacillus salivarius]MBM6956537.1 hypothetical protein [Ligilactobacillus salivarius]
MKKMILLDDNQNLEEQLQTFKWLDCLSDVMLLRAKGFLDNCITSIFDDVIYDSEKARMTPPLLKWNIPISENFNIYGDTIFTEFGIVKGKVVFQGTSTYGVVKGITWLNNNGQEVRKDYYNQYGWRYMSEDFNNDKIISRTYYSYSQKVIIMENLTTNTVQFMNREELYPNYEALVVDYLIQKGYQVDKLMTNNHNIAEKLPVKDKYLLLDRENNTEKIQTLLEHGRINKVLNLTENKNLALSNVEELNYLHKFPEKAWHPIAYVHTDSENLEQIENLVKELPDIMFYISARTAMSAKLVNLQLHRNVILFHGLSNIEEKSKELLDEASIYLDINHDFYDEQLDMVKQAYFANDLIVTFDNIRHRQKLVLDKNVFKSHEFESLAAYIENIASGKIDYQAELRQQQELINKNILEWKQVVR